MTNTAARVLRRIEGVLFAAGIAALGYCTYVMTDSWIFQRRANQQLERLPESHQTTLIDTAPAHQTATQVRPGGLIGRIEVKRLGVSVAVVEGADAPELAHAAGHIPGTALPGQSGNVGIAAHRDTFFRPIRNIRANDVITVTTPAGDYRYRVVSTQVVKPDDVAVLNSDGTDVLTLVTCYPFSYIGHAPDRFIVRAQEIG